MKFHDTGNTHDSLTHYVNYLLGYLETDTTSFTLAQKARATNTQKYKLALMIYKFNDAWRFDDNGQSDLPIATTTLVVGQRDYGLPSTALGIERAEVKDSGGNYYRLTPMDETDRKGALTGYGESNGTPRRYWVEGRSLFLDPAPGTGSVTLAAGLKIYLPREVNEFTAATTTTEVGFDEPGDRAVAYMVAEEHAAVNKLSVLEEIRFQLYGGIRGGKEVPGILDLVLGQAARRLRDMKPRIRINVENME